MKLGDQKKNSGITLIALVITIIVLLILAGISIATLTGENGILTQAGNAKDETTQAKCEEMVRLAITSLQTENLGDTSSITPEMVANKVMSENNIANVTAEGSSFPTNIVFGDEGVKVGVNLDLTSGEEIVESVYNEEGLEEEAEKNIDLFLYEPIEGTGETASTSTTSLPTKEARITGMNPKYCNSYIDGYHDEETGETYDPTYYDIKLEDGTKITDTLVVPYQVEIDGEMYKITEADITAPGKSDTTGYSYPKVKTIIFPNTIKTILAYEYNFLHHEGINDTVEKIILPKNLQKISACAFAGCSKLEEITIPKSVNSIGSCAFSGCTSLTSIIIPKSVIEIGYDVFDECTNLKTIYCEATSKPDGWNNSWKDGCSAKVQWSYNSNTNQE